MIGVRPSRLSQVLPAALAAILLGFTTPATASDNPPQQQTSSLRAEQLFSEGLSLMKADHCQDALPLFFESQKLDPAAATLTNIATCYVRIGKTASAYRAYQDAARAAILEQKPELQQRTDQALRSLAPTLTRLKIVPLGSARLPEIRINGELVPDVREPIPLDPGENIVEATAPDRDPWRRTVRTPAEGALLVVEVPELASTEDRSPVTATPPTQSPPSTPVDRTTSHVNLKPFVVIGAGVGLTALTVSGILALSANSKQNDSNEFCRRDYCLQPGLDLRHTAASRADTATYAAGIGIVSLATALVLWARDEPSTPAPTTTSYQPSVQVGTRSAFIALQGDL